METWTSDKKSEAIELILDLISSGQSLKSIIDTRPRTEVPSYSTFMVWLSSETEEDGSYTAASLPDRYAHACEQRELKLFDEIIDIADETSRDWTTTDRGEEVVNGEAIQRSKVRIDARKWVLGKMRPSKYGDKVDITSGDKPIQQAPIFGSNPLEGSNG